jgi:hypothetical protein
LKQSRAQEFKMPTRPITRGSFPVGKPVTVLGICDLACGWEFDAPLHIMRPFHLYKEIGSVCPEAMDDAIEDLMLTIDMSGACWSDPSTWPYPPKYLAGLFARATAGRQREGIVLYRSVVTVHRWSRNDDDGLNYDCVSEKIDSARKAR